MKNLKHDAQIVKRAWVTPSVIELPRLTDLTLQSSGGDAVISGAIQGNGNASSGTFAF